jgi:hypothetical protein
MMHLDRQGHGPALALALQAAEGELRDRVLTAPVAGVREAREVDPRQGREVQVGGLVQAGVERHVAALHRGHHRRGSRRKARRIGVVGQVGKADAVVTAQHGGRGVHDVEHTHLVAIHAVAERLDLVGQAHHQVVIGQHQPGRQARLQRHQGGHVQSGADVEIRLVERAEEIEGGTPRPVLQVQEARHREPASAARRPYLRPEAARVFLALPGFLPTGRFFTDLATSKPGPAPCTIEPAAAWAGKAPSADRTSARAAAARADFMGTPRSDAAAAALRFQTAMVGHRACGARRSGLGHLGQHVGTQVDPAIDGRAVELEPFAFDLVAMTRKLFVTTALPYANAAFHIGHMMEYIQADTWVRFQRMRGHEVHFVCADDAHGAPIMIAAEKAGLTPQAFVAQHRGRPPAVPGRLPHRVRQLAQHRRAREPRTARSIYLALRDNA